MMRLFFIAVLSMLIVSSAAAAPGWTAPGWYQVADDIAGPFVWKGPFASESECKASLPPNDDDADYGCEYLATRPSWDE
jgi:hypothetical protein